MNRNLIVVCAAWVALAGINAAQVQAVPFSNGSFETNPGGNPSFAAGTYITGSDGWQAVAAGARIYNATVAPPTDGTDHLALNLSNNPGGVRQTFDTITNGKYRVLFDYAAISNGSAFTYDLSHEIVGITSPTTVSATTSGPNFNTAYTLDEEINFIATGPGSTIQFLSLTAGSSSYGPIIDNVRVEYLGQFVPVPEPASGLLLGLGGLLMIRTARRKKAVHPARVA